MISKKTLSIFSFLIFSFTESLISYGQNISWAVADTGVSDFCTGNRIHSDANGNAYVCGTFYGCNYCSGPGPGGTFISKYDQLGNRIWNKLIYGPGICDSFTDLQGNTLIIGNTLRLYPYRA